MKIILCLILSSLLFTTYAKDLTNPSSNKVVKLQTYNNINPEETNPLSSSHKKVIDDYVNQLIKNELDVLNDKTLSAEAKIAKTKKLIIANLDFNWMAKFVLGAYRTKLTPEQITQFTAIYRNFIIKTYSNLIKDYHGQNPKILEVVSVAQDKFIVSMLIGNLHVEYLIHEIKDSKNDSVFKVADIITEDVSLIRSQQAEFVNILTSKGFEALMEDLAKKL